MIRVQNKTSCFVWDTHTMSAIISGCHKLSSYVIIYLPSCIVYLPENEDPYSNPERCGFRKMPWLVQTTCVYIKATSCHFIVDYIWMSKLVLSIDESKDKRHVIWLWPKQFDLSSIPSFILWPCFWLISEMSLDS